MLVPEIRAEPEMEIVASRQTVEANIGMVSFFAVGYLRF